MGVKQNLRLIGFTRRQTVLPKIALFAVVCYMIAVVNENAMPMHDYVLKSLSGTLAHLRSLSGVRGWLIRLPYAVLFVVYHLVVSTLIPFAFTDDISPIQQHCQKIASILRVC